MASKKTSRPRPPTDSVAGPGSASNSARRHEAKDAGASAFGHTFKDLTLLQRALTHRSLAYETDPASMADTTADNEQLEFVGDAVLGLVVAEALYRRFPAYREGDLTRLRASIVSRRHLSEMAARIDLGSVIRLGKGEERSGGRSKPALLANALEAVIAAIYLDGGLKPVVAFVEQAILEPALAGLDLPLQTPINGALAAAGSGTFSGAVGDHKSALQEHLQAIGAGQPEYVLIAESGPDHRKRFCVEVRTTDAEGVATVLAESQGSTKKSAQQEAARIAFARLVHGNGQATEDLSDRTMVGP